VTHKEKLSMFFISLLEEIEGIDNEDIKKRALAGLLQQVEFQLTEIQYLVRQLNKQ